MEKNGNKILIVLISYKLGKKILPCLESISRQTYQNFELYIVDNNSEDDTINVIKTFLKENRKLESKTKIICNNKNTGFAKAVNQGLKYALLKNMYAVLLINQDTSFEPNLLNEGLKVLASLDIGAACPKILYDDKRIWWNGTELYTSKQIVFSTNYGISKHIGKGNLYQQEKSDLSFVAALNGCAMFIKTDVINEVGDFNEKFFMYGEDLDYSNRIRKRGFNLAKFNTSTVYHLTDDRDKSTKKVLANLRKYRIYLTSTALYLIDNYPFYVFLGWLVKLPLVLALNFAKMRH